MLVVRVKGSMGPNWRRENGEVHDCAKSEAMPVESASIAGTMGQLRLMVLFSGNDM
jgi:hypothetical protein